MELIYYDFYDSYDVFFQGYYLGGKSEGVCLDRLDWYTNMNSVTGKPLARRLCGRASGTFRWLGAIKVLLCSHIVDSRSFLFILIVNSKGTSWLRTMDPRTVRLGEEETMQSLHKGYITTRISPS